MRINLLLPFVELAGSIKATLHFANGLAAGGHAVRVVYPVRDRGKELVRALRRTVSGRRVSWFDLQVPLHPVERIGPDTLPEADATIAVDYTTAIELAKCGTRGGAPGFLIQGYDVFMAPEREVHAAWRLPMGRIVVSSWLLQIAERVGVQAAGPLVYGVDHTIFYPERGARGSAREQRVGMLYHPHPNKGFADGRAAFLQAREQFPGLVLVCYGGKPPSHLDGIEYHKRPLGATLRRIYNSCATWIVPSWTEGCHMVAMEALACGCALVSTEVGGIRDYAQDGVSVLISPPRAPERLAANLARVLGEPLTREGLAHAGQEGIRRFTWENSTAQFERWVAGVAAG